MKNTKLIFKLNGKLHRAIGSGNRFLPEVVKDVIARVVFERDVVCNA